MDITFAAGLLVGVVLATLALGFLAIGAYDRGYEDADMRRRQWRAELGARHVKGHI